MNTIEIKSFFAPAPYGTPWKKSVIREHFKAKPPALKDLRDPNGMKQERCKKILDHFGDKEFTAKQACEVLGMTECAVRPVLGWMENTGRLIKYATKTNTSGNAIRAFFKRA